MKDLEKEYPILKEDLFYRKIKKKNRKWLINMVEGVFEFIPNILFK